MSRAVLMLDLFTSGRIFPARLFLPHNTFSFHRHPILNQNTILDPDPNSAVAVNCLEMR